MSSVDDRVVKITFDNAGFERKIAQTIASLDELSKSFDMSGAQESIQSLSAEANNFDVSAMAQGIDLISSKLSAMGAVGFTVIQNLTNTFLDLGKGLASTAFESILGGGRQRALNIEQAQFQFRGLGIDVAKGMESALAAVKGTAFGLDEAAKAASQFAASGIEVGEKMTGALRGVAGAAAMTGTSFTEIAQIFTGAAATGKVTGQDLQQFATRGLNVAAALGKVLGKTELEVREMASEGKLSFKIFSEAMDEAFGEHATKANETFSGALANVRAALSRFGASFFGPSLIQQRDILNTLAPVVDKLTTAFKPLTDMLLEMSRISLENTTKALNNLDFKAIGTAVTVINRAFLSLWSILRPIKDAFRDIFPPATGERLQQIAQAIFDFTNRMGQTLTTSIKVREIFGGLFALLEIGWHVVKGVVSVFNSLVGSFNPINNKFGELLVKIAQFIKALNVALVEGGGLKRFFETLSRVLGTIRDFIGKILTPLGKLRDLLIGFFGKISFDDITVGVDKLQAGFSKFAEVLENMKNLIVDIFNNIPFNKVTDQVDKVKEKFSGIFGEVKADKEMQALTTDFTKFGGVVGDLFKNIGNTSSLEELKVDLVSFRDNLKNTFDDSIPGVEGWRSSMGACVKEIEGTNTIVEKLSNTIVRVGDIFDQNLGVTEKWRQTFALFSGAVENANLQGESLDTIWSRVADRIKSFGKTAEDAPGFFEKLGTAIKGFFEKVVDIIEAVFTGQNWDRLLETMRLGLGLSLVGLLKKLLSKDDWGFLDQFLAPFREFMDGLKDAVKTWERGKKIEMLRNLAVAIAILAVALSVLALIDPEGLARGLGAITIGLAEMIGAMKLMDMIANDDDMMKGLQKSGRMETLIAGLVAMAAALLILAFAVEKFGKMDIEVLKQGGIAVTVAIGVLVAAMHALPDEKDMIGFGVGLIAMSVALLILHKAIFKFSQTVKTWEGAANFAKGLFAVGVTVALLAASMRLLPDNKTIIKAGIAFLLLSASLVIIAFAIKILAKLDLLNLIAAVLSLAGLIMVLTNSAIALNAAMPGAQAFAVMAAGLLLIAVALKTIGELSIFDILKAVGAIVVLLAVLVGLSILATIGAPVLAAFEALAAGLLVVGAAFALFGVSIYLFAKGIKTLSSIDSKGLKRLRDVLLEIGGTLPTIIAGFFKGIVDGVKTVIKAIPGLLEELGKTFDDFIAFVEEYGEKFIDLGWTMVKGFMQKFEDNAQELSQTGINIVTNLIKGLTEKNPVTEKSPLEDFIVTFGDFLVQLLDGIGNAADPVIEAWSNMWVKIIRGMTPHTAKLAEALSFLIVVWIHHMGKDFAVPIVNKFVGFWILIFDALAAKIGDLEAAITRFLNAIADSIVRLSGVMIRAGVAVAKSLLGGMAIGILAATAEIFRIIKIFLTSLTNLIRENAPEIAEKFEALGVAIAEGIGYGLGKVNPITFVRAAARGWYEAFLGETDSNSPSKMFMPIGAYIAQGVAVGMMNDKTIESTIGGMTDSMVTAFQGTLSKVPAELAVMDEFQPKITPVLDLTGVQKDAQGLGGMLGTTPLNAELSAAQAASLASMTANVPDAMDASSTQPTSIVFEQNIHAPTQLSTSDIYRQTRGQIALAKEQLKL